MDGGCLQLEAIQTVPLSFNQVEPKLLAIIHFTNIFPMIRE